MGGRALVKTTSSERADASMPGEEAPSALPHGADQGPEPNDDVGASATTTLAGTQDQEPQESGIHLACKRCGHSWCYRGLKRPETGYPLYVSCPRCRTLVRLRRSE